MFMDTRTLGLTLPDKEHNVQANYFPNSSKLKSTHPARPVILQKNNKYLPKNKYGSPSAICQKGIKLEN
jgi:hypothetical protein